MKLRLVKTCGACPEQYDVFFGEEEVGYMRLRHGCFRAEYKSNIVYQTYTIGDGVFTNEERDVHLTKACLAILSAHKENTIPMTLYEIVDNLDKEGD